MGKMSQKFASGRSVGTRLSAHNFTKYFRAKKNSTDRTDIKGASGEPCELQYDPSFKPCLLAHKKLNISTALFLTVSGALLLLVSPFCSHTVEDRCWTSATMPYIYKRAQENGENLERIRWIFSLRYVGGLLLGLGIFYLIMIVQFNIWKRRMGVALMKRVRQHEEVMDEEDRSNFNVYDIMVKAWVREQRAVNKKKIEREDESLPVIDADSIESVESENYTKRSPVTYCF